MVISCRNAFESLTYMAKFLVINIVLQVDFKNLYYISILMSILNETNG